MQRLAITVLGLLLLFPASIVHSEDAGFRVLSKPGKYEDVRDDVKDAILKRGFVIDYVGQFNAMLERTADVAGRKSPYRNAEYIQFCPSKLTHDAVTASPAAIANCPIAIFVYELAQEAGKIVVGYRLPIASSTKSGQDANARLADALKEIVAEATKK